MWSAISRASARSSRSGATCSLTSATRSTLSLSKTDIAASDGDEHVDDRRLLDRVEPAHRAEVDEPERAVTEDEDVPRMRVGVEEAVAEHLVEHRAQQPLGEESAVAAPLSGLLGIGNGHPFEPLLDEEPVGAEIAVDLRDPHVAGRTDERRHLLHGRRLALEVEL